MPKRLTVIGLLFCFGGIAAVWHMVSALFFRSFTFDVAVFMFPVGWGLLGGRRSSRNWATAWICSGYALSAVIIVWGLQSPSGLRATLGDHVYRGSAALPYIGAAVLIFAAGLSILLWLLWSKRVSDYLDLAQRDAASGESDEHGGGEPAALMGPESRAEQAHPADGVR